MMTRAWNASKPASTKADFGLIGAERMPQYRKRKTDALVWALQIARRFPAVNSAPVAHGLILGFDTVRCQAGVGEGYAATHDPQIGGYFVRNANGTVSYASAEAFEAAYTAIKGGS